MKKLIHNKHMCLENGSPPGKERAIRLISDSKKRRFGGDHRTCNSVCTTLERFARGHHELDGWIHCDNKISDRDFPCRSSRREQVTPPSRQPSIIMFRA